MQCTRIVTRSGPFICVRSVRIIHVVTCIDDISSIIFIILYSDTRWRAPRRLAEVQAMDRCLHLEPSERPTAQQVALEL